MVYIEPYIWNATTKWTITKGFKMSLLRIPSILNGLKCEQTINPYSHNKETRSAPIKSCRMKRTRVLLSLYKIFLSANIIPFKKNYICSSAEQNKKKRNNLKTTKKAFFKEHIHHQVYASCCHQSTLPLRLHAVLFSWDTFFPSAQSERVN